MLNLKSLFNKILTDGVMKSGATMTGAVQLSFANSVGNFIASGYYNSSQTTMVNLMNEVRLSSGAMGKFTLSSDYTLNGVTIPAATYEFIYSPHRRGGINGTETGDNCRYGNIILINATNGSSSRGRVYTVRVNSVSGSASIVEIREMNTMFYTPSYSRPTATTNSYYSLKTNSSYVYSFEGSHLHMITLYVECTTAQTGWNNIGTYSSIYKVAYDYNFSLTNTAGTILQGYLASNGNIYVRQGYNGHGFAGTFAYISSD